jgi:integrase
VRGEGTIFRRASDGLWVIRMEIGIGPGLSKRVTRYARTESAALDTLRRLRREAEAGRLVADGNRMRLGKYLEYWLTELLPGTVKLSTEASYADITRRYLIPGLGQAWLQKLTRVEVRQFLRQLQERKSARPGTDAFVSPRTIQYVHAVLRRALEDARREELVGRNVAKEVSPPRVEREEIEPLSADQARRLLAAAEGDRLYPLYVLALLLGLRRGELLALRWSSIDLDRRVLRVRRQLQRVSGKLIYTTPKTKRSRRAVPLPKVCVRVLRDHKEAQEKQRANAEVWSDDDLVFTTSIGTPIEPRNLSRHFEALRKRAGLEHVRFHDLRHSCASLLFDLDVPLRMVMEILGHAQIATTADLYTHVMPAPYAEVADALDTWFGGDGDEAETL